MAQRNTIIINPHINPPVGPIRTKNPPLNPEKTGTPIPPSKT